MSDVTEESAKTNAWPKGIFAITLFTEDLEQTKKFYQNAFGLPIDNPRREPHSEGHCTSGP